MQNYISYDVTVEERITADREVQVMLEKLCAKVVAAWSRLNKNRACAGD